MQNLIPIIKIQIQFPLLVDIKAFIYSAHSSSQSHFTKAKNPDHF